MTTSKDILSAFIKAKGEGSRGGKIIGHTKSGKPIYDAPGRREAHPARIAALSLNYAHFRHHSALESKELGGEAHVSGGWTKGVVDDAETDKRKKQLDRSHADFLAQFPSYQIADHADAAEAHRQKTLAQALSGGRRSGRSGNIEMSKAHQSAVTLAKKDPSP